MKINVSGLDYIKGTDFLFCINFSGDWINNRLLNDFRFLVYDYDFISICKDKAITKAFSSEISRIASLPSLRLNTIG